MHTKSSGPEWSKVPCAGVGESSIKEFAEHRSAFGEGLSARKSAQLVRNWINTTLFKFNPSNQILKNC